MLVLVCYDVSTVTPEGERRLRRVAAICKDHGVRVQYSVFECRLEPARWVAMRHALLEAMDVEGDSLRFYFINEKDFQRTEHHGVRRPLDPMGPLVV